MWEVNQILILKKKDYVDITEDILSDMFKFKLIKGNWLKYIISLEHKLDRTLRKIKNKLTEVTYNFLFASGVLYGLPKVPKDGCPIRPILSAIKPSIITWQKNFVPVLSHLTINQ